MDDTASTLPLNLPATRAVYGWLGLDRRGNWLLKGGRVSNSRLADYLACRYTADDAGRWYVQYGFQQVFVDLEYTPLVIRLAGLTDAGPSLVTHGGHTVTTVGHAWLDEAGSLLLETESGIGVLDDRDLDGLLACFRGRGETALDEDALDAAIECLQRGDDPGLVFRYRQSIAPVKSIAASAVPATFGFVQRPSKSAP